MQLNYSPFFNPEQTFSEDTPPQVEILTTGTVVPQGGLCQLDFTASDADSSLGGAILIRAGQVVAEMSLEGGQLFGTISTYDYLPGVEDKWHLLVFDTQGNRALSPSALVTCAEGYNRAPYPYVKVSKSRIEVGEEVILDAGGSFDPDGDFSQLKVEWDLDGDGNFDTSPSTTKTHHTVYMESGIYRIMARLTDKQGDSSLSMPMGIRVEQPAPPLPKSVDIDIKPGHEQNAIHPRARGSLWVAVLSDSEFDSLQINIPTVRFGPGEASAIRHRVGDINRDGLEDVWLRFKLPQTGIACGDTEATLTGETFSGQSITGIDSIKAVGCKKKWRLLEK